MRKELFIVVWAVLFSACDTGQKNLEEEDKIDFQTPNLLNSSFFSEAAIFNVSFPIWFNQALVEEYEIDAIFLESNVLNWTSDSSFTKELDYSFVYKFNVNGRLKKSTFTDYYKLAQLFEVSFDYSKSTPDTTGYVLPRIKRTPNLLIEANPTKLLHTLSDLQRFDRFELLHKDDKTITFKNTTSRAQESHCFIVNPAHQNILFIDKLEMKPEDVFYYGSPLHYSKAFRLTDLVKEELRTETFFYEGENYPKTQQTQKSGLITKSTFLYTPNGSWVGQRDSLILNTGQFIKLTESEISYNAQNLPARILIKTGSCKEDLRTSRVINLNYAFRTKQKK